MESVVSFALVPYGRGNAGQTAGLACLPGYHSGRLKQEFRYDIWDQPATRGNRTSSLEAAGLEFITSSADSNIAWVYRLIRSLSPNVPSVIGDLPV